MIISESDIFIVSTSQQNMSPWWVKRLILRWAWRLTVPASWMTNTFTQHVYVTLHVLRILSAHLACCWCPTAAKSRHILLRTYILECILNCWLIWWDTHKAGDAERKCHLNIYQSRAGLLSTTKYACRAVWPQISMSHTHTQGQTFMQALSHTHSIPSISLSLCFFFFNVSSGERSIQVLHLLLLVQHTHVNMTVMTEVLKVKVLESKSKSTHNWYIIIYDILDC